MKKNNRTKEAPCTVCGIYSNFEIGFSNINLYRCPNCDHCFTKADFTNDSKDYSLKYFNEVHQNWFNNPNVRLFEIISRTIKNNKPDASIIDIGCGKGDFLKYIHKKTPSLSLTGIDLITNSPVEGIKFIQGDILSMNLNRQYDVVISIAVIEHVSDVQVFIQKVCDLCIPGGLVIITSINERSILYSIARLLYHLGYKVPLERLYERHHLNHFNVSSLKRLVGNSGLSVKKTFMHNIPLVAVDVPAHSPVTYYILKLGVCGTFIFGLLTRRTFLQTIICLKLK